MKKILILICSLCGSMLFLIMIDFMHSRLLDRPLSTSLSSIILFMIIGCLYKKNQKKYIKFILCIFLFLFMPTFYTEGVIIEHLEKYEYRGTLGVLLWGEVVLNCLWGYISDLMLSFRELQYYSPRVSSYFLSLESWSIILNPIIFLCYILCYKLRESASIPVVFKKRYLEFYLVGLFIYFVLMLHWISSINCIPDNYKYMKNNEIVSCVTLMVFSIVYIMLPNLRFITSTRLKLLMISLIINSPTIAYDNILSIKPYGVQLILTFLQSFHITDYNNRYLEIQTLLTYFFEDYYAMSILLCLLLIPCIYGLFFKYINKTYKD